MRHLVHVSALIAASVVGGVHAYGQDAAKIKDVKEAVQTAAYDITDKHSSIINFSKGSAELTQSEKSSLRSTLNAFKDDAALKEIVVVTWSDLPYPSGKDQGDRPKKSRDLAEKRGKAIEKVLEDAGGKNIKIYNMAEKSNWFEKTFATHDAQVKHEAEKTPANTDSDDAFYQALGRRITAVGGPSKAVVVMRGDFLVSH